MTPSTSPSADTAKKTLWPYGIAAALILVSAVNISMVTIALRHPSAPATHEHWREAVEFNDEYARRQESARLGWHVEVRPCKPGSDTCEIEINVNDRNALPISQLTGEIALSRGDTEALDRTATLQETSQGHYLAKVNLGAGGHYVAKLKLAGKQGTWHGEQSLRVGKSHL